MKIWILTCTTKEGKYEPPQVTIEGVFRDRAKAEYTHHALLKNWLEEAGLHKENFSYHNCYDTHAWNAMSEDPYWEIHVEQISN